MIHRVAEWFGAGVDPKHLTALQMSLRAALFFALGLALVRFASKRFLGRNAPFDTVVAVMLGSLLSRAINGSGPMIPTLAAGAVLVAFHWLVSFIAFRSRGFWKLAHGDKTLLVEHGQPVRANLRRTHYTREDLLEGLRLHGFASLEDVAYAYLEANGRLSALKQDESKPEADTERERVWTPAKDASSSEHAPS